MNLSTLSKLTEEQAREKLESIRWANGVVCPHCGRVDGHTKAQASGNAMTNAQDSFR
jgi:hypothetical protein